MAAESATAEPYPRFSDEEMQRRRAALDAVAERHEVDHVLLRGAERAGSAIAWLTRWPVTREALVVHTAGERDRLLVAFYNHVPNATRMATEADVAYAGARPIDAALQELERRGARGRRLGVIGPLGHRDHDALGRVVGDVISLDADYTQLRQVKSAEELDWLREGVAFTDRGLQALLRHARPGVDEAQLGDLVERAYVAAGGTTHIHYFAATAMDAPGMSAPAQWPSSRRLAADDVLTCELSAAFWGYAGQVLRTIVVGADPSPLIAELHDVAQAAFDALFAALRPGVTAAELLAASSVIEDAGFTIRDDLVHGFVGGYLPPVLGSASRELEPVPDFTYREGMTVVLQPNVVTPDERAGVQTGELVLVGPRGAQRLHSAPGGLLRI